MKKLFTFLAGISMSMLCTAQLQNGNFENWNTQSASGPNLWVMNSNEEAMQRGMPSNVTQYTPAFDGNFSVRLETISNSTDTVFGYITNTRDMDNMTGGFPYTMSPDSFICHAKLGIQAGDTAVILVVFKNGGTPIGMNMLSLTGNNPNVWQRLAFKLSTLPMAPDSVVIAAVSSNAFVKRGIPGSFMILDDFAFSTSMPIPEGGFENWSILFSYEMLADWDTKSAMDFIRSGLGNPVKKTTDKYEGQYALKMTTTAGNQPNWFFTGINNGNWNNTLMRFTGGFSFNNQVDTLIGWYKYTPKTSDSGQVNIEFRKTGTSLGQYSTPLPASGSFIRFEVPFNLSQVPDTAVITINSSSWPFTYSDTGSVLIIDALKFKSSQYVGIQNFFANAVLIGPNPTSGEFSLYYIPKNRGSAFTICDGTGKAIKNALLNGTRTNIDISDYPKGIYFVKITDGKSIISKKLILQ